MTLRLKQSLRSLGLVLFIGSIATLGWWWSVRAGNGGPGGGIRAAMADVALFSLFALHHSVLARPSARRLVGLVVPEDLMRTSYVVTASVLLVSMCVLWRPIGGTVYRVNGPF